jgi:hypothetical protein
MDASLLGRVTELQEENRRLKKLYVQAELKADIIAEALAKNSEALSPTRGGQTGGRGARADHPAGLRGVRAERERLPLPAAAERREPPDSQLAGPADGQLPQLGVWPTCICAT